MPVPWVKAYRHEAGQGVGEGRTVLCPQGLSNKHERFARENDQIPLHTYVREPCIHESETPRRRGSGAERENEVHTGHSEPGKR